MTAFDLDLPFFSVIVAAYNPGERILPTIRSVLAQSYRRFEIIVIGDGIIGHVAAGGDALVLMPTEGRQIVVLSDCRADAKAARSSCRRRSR